MKIQVDPRQLELGERLRDEALDRMEVGSDAEWIDEAVEVIRDLVGLEEYLTSDDVWAAMEDDGIDPPRERRAMGAAFRRAKGLGIVAPTNRIQQSVRAECHRRPIRVWMRWREGGQR